MGKPAMVGVSGGRASDRKGPMATKTTTAQSVEAFVSAARREGFSWKVNDRGLDVVEITKSFAPGDRDAYVQCDATAYSVLMHAPVVAPGTTWGTDGASVGGHAGMIGGYFRLAKSGVSKRFLKALVKIS